MLLLRSFCVLVLFQLAGEGISHALHLPLPGPVLGMSLLAAFYLMSRRAPSAAMQSMSNGLLRWMGLLFVPAGVGIVAKMGLLRAQWLPVTVALVGSTLLTMVVVAGVMHWMTRRHV